MVHTGRGNFQRNLAGGHLLLGKFLARGRDNAVAHQFVGIEVSSGAVVPYRRLQLGIVAQRHLWHDGVTHQLHLVLADK